MQVLPNGKSWAYVFHHEDLSLVLANSVIARIEKGEAELLTELRSLLSCKLKSPKNTRTTGDASFFCRSAHRAIKSARDSHMALPFKPTADDAMRCALSAWRL